MTQNSVSFRSVRPKELANIIRYLVSMQSLETREWPRYSISILLDLAEDAKRMKESDLTAALSICADAEADPDGSIDKMRDICRYATSVGFPMPNEFLRLLDEPSDEEIQ